jgi:hypothetical protein
MTLNRISQLSTRCLILAALAAAPAVAQPAPPDRPAPPAPPVPPAAVAPAPPQTIEGTVDGFNRDPRGHINSVVVKTADGKLDQFNLPPDLGDQATRIAADGQKVTVVGSPERTVGDRTIFRLSRLTGADGKSALTAPTPGTPEPTDTVEGTVKRLNFSPRGEVDGALLDNDDYVHTGVEAGAGLTVGGKLSVTGVTHPMTDGHRAVEAQTVNGRPVPRPPVHPEQGPGHNPGPRPARGPRPGPDGMIPPAPDDATPPAPPAPPAGR